tara:strand:- start:1807 stop:2757 length:951 start_codon:yes stop_codon:yes gene_type:complete
MNQLLSISIPVYERVDSFRANIPKILEYSMGLDIPVYILDDSKSHDIRDVCSNLKENFDNLFYIRNERTLGHDKNFITSLLVGDSEYIWVLGDRVALKEGCLETVLAAINGSGCDIISVNKLNRNIDFSSGQYKDPSEVLQKFGWHLTYTGATIYSKRVIAKLQDCNLDRSKNFPQIALIFNYLSIDCSFYWVNERLIQAVASSQSYWLNNALSVFIGDWEAAVLNLPDIYQLSLKRQTILAHSKNTRLFSIRLLLKLRESGGYDYEVLTNFRARLIEHSGIPYFLLYILSVYPQWILSLFRVLIKFVYRKELIYK